MILKLSGLTRGETTEYTLKKCAEDYNLPKEHFNDVIRLTAILMDCGDYIEGSIHIETSSRRLCDRCAIEFNLTIDVVQHLMFISEEGRERGDFDDVIYYHPDNPLVDISQHIYDAIMLAPPMKILCSEECRGLCPRCGADLNYERCRCSENPTDPKWSALIELREKLEK